MYKNFAEELAKWSKSGCGARWGCSCSGRLGARMACRKLERDVLGKKGVLLSHSVDHNMEVLTCSTKKLETMKERKDLYQRLITAVAKQRVVNMEHQLTEKVKRNTENLEEWQAKLSRLEGKMSQAQLWIETLRIGTDMTPAEGSE